MPGEVEIAELSAALKECSDELAAWVAHYYEPLKRYSSEMRRYERDMEPVVRARALLVKLGAVSLTWKSEAR